MNSLTLILVYVLLPRVTSDHCNPLSSLITTDTFYLTQPYKANIPLDLSNYEEAFAQLSEKVKLFNANIELYDEKSELSEVENVTPFNDDYNVFKIDTETKGYASFEACHKRNGSIVSMTNENRKAIVEKLNELHMEKTPFKALPFYSLFSLQDSQHLDNVHFNHILPLWMISPPFITKNNVIEYPFQQKPTPADWTDPTGSGKAKPATVETTINDYSSPQVLCLKENNPWDLPANRNKWLELASKAKKAAQLVTMVKDSFVHSKHHFKSLPSKTKTRTLELFKMILPEPLKSILNFLDRFSRKSNWEKATMRSNDVFRSFAKDSQKLANMFQLSPQSFAKISENDTSFQHLHFDKMNWFQILKIDEEKYGIAGPITISPHTSLQDDQPSSRDALQLLVTASLRIYNRKTNKMTLYSVRPNFYQGYLTTAKTVLQGHHFMSAHTEHLKPSECHIQPEELHPVCNKLHHHSAPSHLHQHLSTCASALFDSKATDDFYSCPYEKAPAEPYIYRANCNKNGPSSTIINSLHPVTLSFYCDSEHKLNWTFTEFPSKLETECEVRLNSSGENTVALPQMTDDFLQDPQITTDLKSPKTPPPIINLNLVLILSITIPITISLILTIAVTFFCRYKKRKVHLNRTLSQNQIRELQTFNEYPVLAIR